eukprot:gene12612-16910_t
MIGDLPDSEPSNSIKDRLFNLRMKINQGRKANKEEVEAEYKRFTNKSKFQSGSEIETEEAGDVNQQSNSNKAGLGKKGRKQQMEKIDIMQQTAVEAEKQREKLNKKEENMATLGFNAATTESTNRSYEKRLKKLPTTTAESKGTSTVFNPFEYGKTGSQVSNRGIERLVNDIEEREESRRKFSKRRMNVDGADVDYINDKNAIFNQKTKKAFNKYTVEIRQNLERGTAV